MSKTKLTAAGIAALVVIAAIYFKVDIKAALDNFTSVSTTVEKSISE